MSGKYFWELGDKVRTEKLRRTDWDAREWIKWDTAVLEWRKRDGGVFKDAWQFGATRWEIIEENPHKEGSFNWARWHMERGVICSRAGRTWQIYQGRFECKLPGNTWHPVFGLLFEALDATDWRLVEDTDNAE